MTEAEQKGQAAAAGREHGHRRRERTGVVVSDAMTKTVVVRIEQVYRHPRYEKVMRRSRKFCVHDEGDRAHVGDVVRIRETRPLSRDKRWRIVEVIEKGAIALLPDNAEGQK